MVDCRRDLEVELGVAFRERIGPAMSLLLQAARWYTFRIGELYRTALTKAFEEAAAGAATCDYLTFWQHAKVHFPEDRSPSAHIVQATREMQEKWAAIALDFDRAVPWLVYAKEHATRADHMWVSRQDVDLELGTTRSWRPRENVLAVGSLVVERNGGQLVVRDRDRRYQFGS